MGPTSNAKLAGWLKERRANLCMPMPRDFAICGNATKGEKTAQDVLFFLLAKDTDRRWLSSDVSQVLEQQRSRAVSLK